MSKMVGSTLPWSGWLRSCCQRADGWVFHLGLDNFEHMYRGQLAENISPASRWLGAFHLRAYDWVHFTRRQITWNTLLGDKKLEALCQVADSWMHFTRRQAANNLEHLARGRKLEGPCQGANSLAQLAKEQMAGVISPGGR